MIMHERPRGLIGLYISAYSLNPDTRYGNIGTEKNQSCVKRGDKSAWDLLVRYTDTNGTDAFASAAVSRETPATSGTAANVGAAGRCATRCTNGTVIHARAAVKREIHQAASRI